MNVILKLFIILSIFDLISSEIIKSRECTDIARDQETYLLISTLGGGLTAVDPITSETKWFIEEEPALKMENSPSPSQYLPDPRDGSLYQFNFGTLKKLPYTIPELVASAPCKSSDGILFSGKKSDSWFLIDPKTGRREQVLGFGSEAQKSRQPMTESIGWATSRAVYLGRTQYTVLMYDSFSKDKIPKPWNVTFFDYSSLTMTPEISDKYEFLHVASSSQGSVVTIDRMKSKESFLWQKDFKSPVVAIFLLGKEGLLSVPFTTVSDNVLMKVAENAKEGGQIDFKLFNTVYIGESSTGSYAIPSLVDQNTPTIKLNAINLLEGPTKDFKYKDSILESNIQGSDNNENDFIIFGHYDQNIVINQNIQIQQSPRTIENQLTKISNINLYKWGKGIITTDPSIIPTDNENSIDQNSSLRDNLSDSTKAMKKSGFLKTLVLNFKLWFDHEENKVIKLLLIIFVGLFIAMFWYLHNTVRELRQSQNGSQTNGLRGNNKNGSFKELEQLQNGEIRVGKICFNPKQVLGKGCEGTFVFKGTFEKRQVAVKRLLPECFTLADREVSLLRESDQHENVVRYFCTEQDLQFRYIAVELCAATLQDYSEGKRKNELQKLIDKKEILIQTTNGLIHLHQLNIVHRDLKPQNVLISMPDERCSTKVRVMISDFGLCKKLNIGKSSFSRRSGITGTDGWISAEMHKGERTTTSVDIFSLGCVFYYVLTDGLHIFGDSFKRQANILAAEYNFGGLDSTDSSESILAIQLIKDMINHDPAIRPKASTVKNHPLFWDTERILSFLQDVSDRVEKEDLSTAPLKELERNAKFVVKNDWSDHLDPEVTADLRRYRGYHGFSVRDLLRALRNKKHHYHDLSAQAQRALGTLPREFTYYWIDKFPALLSHSYHAMQSCAEENLFKGYYTGSETFTKPIYFQRIDNENIELIAAYESAKTQKCNYKNAFDSSTKPTNRGAYNFKGGLAVNNYLHNNYNNCNKSETSFITRGEMIQQTRHITEVLDHSTLTPNTVNISSNQIDDFIPVKRRSSRSNNSDCKLVWTLPSKK